MSLLLLFAGAGRNGPPPIITKVFGRAGAGDAARSRVAVQQAAAELSTGATYGGLTTGETAGGVESGETGGSVEPGRTPE